MISRVYYGFLTGLCAASASVFGKLSGSSFIVDWFIIRVILFSLMILSNIGVCTFFVKALHQCSSSLRATVISSSSNYILSALCGYLIFGEITTWIWWLGFLCILGGLFLIIEESNNGDKKD